MSRLTKQRTLSKVEFGFNPVLGFLSVSTSVARDLFVDEPMFQSRAGFSECLDNSFLKRLRYDHKFQSRAGFSECLD